VRQRLRRLARRARAWPREDRLALEDRLEQLAPTLERLLDSRRSGRGRALFVAVTSGESCEVVLPEGLPQLAALEERARVRPLLAVLQAEGPAGVVVVSSSKISIAQWELGAVVELETLDLASVTRARSGRKGRPGVTRASARQSSPERDRFEQGREATLSRVVASTAGRLRMLADARPWDAVLASGETRLVGVVGEAFGSNGVGSRRAPR
jgi:hypothetical protein